MTELDHNAEATEAHALVDALLERIRSGDTTVTSDELDNARKLAEFAELRAEAAERKAWEAERDHAAERLRLAADRVREVVGTSPYAATGEIDSLTKKATKAFDALMTAVEARWAESFRAARALRIANERAAHYDLPDSMGAHGVSYSPTDERFRIVNERGSTSAVDWQGLKDPDHWIKVALELAGIHLNGNGSIHSSRKVELTLDEPAD